MEEYAKLMIQKREIEARLEILKPEIISKMESEREETEFGVFTISSKRTYTYSEMTQEMEKEVKAKKKEEEQTGDATYTEAPVLKFLTNKE